MYDEHTWSPTLTLSTPGPTRSTTPAASWPSTTGKGCGTSPLMRWEALWHTPLATHRTCTSCGPGSSSSTSSITRGFFTSYRTAAVAFIWTSSRDVVPSGPTISIKVARDQTPTLAAQRGLVRRAVGHRERAARMESAPTGRGQRARDLTRQRDLFARLVELDRQRRRDQRFRVGMLRRQRHGIGVADLDDLAEVHH